jgi:RimJ/RimL family protein N-acetyltransferase
VRKPGARTIGGVPELRTERLLLRQWRDEDLEPFAVLNGDPETMRHFPAPLTRSTSDAFVRHARRQIEAEGWGLWAVEVVGGAPFVGFVGLARPSFEAHFTPAVEVGWRLAREHWGMGYATEAGRHALRFGFEELGLPEIVSFTSRLNEPSQRVMERLGMRRDPADDFEHPRLPERHPLRAHVLYRLGAGTA